MILGVDRRSEKVEGCNHGMAIDEANPFAIRFCRPPRPMEEYIPLLVMFSSVLLCAVALLIVGLVKKSFAIFQVVLLAAVFVSCAIRIVFYSFWAISIGEGFTQFTGSTENFAVSIEAANIIERLGAVFFVALFAICTYVLLSAALSTFFPNRNKLLVVLTVLGAAVLVLSTGYSIAMVVVSNIHVDLDIPLDMGRILLACLSVVFCGALVCTWILVLFATRGNYQFESHKKRTVIFLIGSSILLIAFILTLVLACLYTFVEVATWGRPYFFTQATSEFLAAFAILSYIFAAVRAKVMGDKSNYVSMIEQSEEEERDDFVPLLYKAY